MRTVGLRRRPTADLGWVSRTTRCTATGWPRERRNLSSRLAGSLSCTLGERPPPVDDLRSLPDEVAVVVVLVGPPLIAVAVHGPVDVLALDGEQSPRAQQKMVDLAAAVTVAPQQRPVIPENPAEYGHGYGLALHSGPEDLFLIGGPADRESRPRNAAPPLTPHAQSAPQPHQPAALSTSLIPRLPCLLNPHPVPRQCVLVLGSRPLLAGQPAPGACWSMTAGWLDSSTIRMTQPPCARCFRRDSATPPIAANHSRSRRGR